MEVLKGLFVPVYKTLGRLLKFQLTQLLFIPMGLKPEFRILDLMLRGLDKDNPLRIKPRPTGTSGNLMKLASIQTAHLIPVKLA